MMQATAHHCTPSIKHIRTSTHSYYTERLCELDFISLEGTWKRGTIIVECNITNKPCMWERKKIQEHMIRKWRYF